MLNINEQRYQSKLISEPIKNTEICYTVIRVFVINVVVIKNALHRTGLENPCRDFCH